MKHHNHLDIKFDLFQMVEILKIKMKFYIKATNVAYTIEVCENERMNQLSFSKNIKIAYLFEIKNEISIRSFVTFRILFNKMIIQLNNLYSYNQY